MDLPFAPEVLLAHVIAPAQGRDALEERAFGRLVRDLDHLSLRRRDDVQAAEEVMLVGDQRVAQRPAIERDVGLLRVVEPQLREAIEVPRPARVFDAALEAIDDRVLPVLAQVGDLRDQRPVLLAPVGLEVLRCPGLLLADQAHSDGSFGFQCHGISPLQFPSREQPGECPGQANIATEAHAKRGVAETVSNVHAAASTPIDWPMKRKHAKSDIAAPRVAGAIWVAWVCNVPCKA